MSKDKIKKVRTRAEHQKLLVRIVALVLAALMIGGMAYYTIYILVSSASAAEIETDSSETVIDTSSLKISGDVLISVGLMFGSNLTKGFEITSTDGYVIGRQLLSGDRELDELWDIDDEKISCTVDSNLSKTGMTYLVAESRSSTVIGGYHIQVDCGRYDRGDVEKMLEDAEYDVDRLGLYMIPSYIYDEYAIRIGSFASYDDAQFYLDDIEFIFMNEDVSIVSPTRTAVSVLNPDTDRILFEFDCGAESELGIAAHEDINGNTYIKTPAANIYDGVFCFKRYDNGDVEGVEVINFLPLEAYLAGVLPYETSNTWPLETLKAFAITVRSYTLTHLEKHMDMYGFDLCNTTNCQVYKGAGRINERIMTAVLETAGKVMTYDNEIATAYYSSSMGGVTVSAQDAWGGRDDIPYLQAVETPWERYMVHNNAFWMYEISPTALLERLHTAGFTQLEDEIDEVEIIELAKNSTYVKTLKVTDIHGTSIYIENTDTVRTSLTPYVKSANFVVGRGSVEYTENVIVEDDYMDLEYDVYDDYSPTDSYDRDYGYINVDECYIITADSLERNDYDGSLGVMTGDDYIEHGKIDIFVMARQNTAAFLGDEYAIYAIDEETETEYDSYKTSIVEDKSNDEVIYKVAYAENDDNFIFVGKGWGHGVGMSQYGARDLADLGYSAEEILEAYFTGTEIIDYEDSDNFK